MTTKKKLLHGSFLLQRLFGLFGPEETHEVEVQQMTNSEYYFFLVYATSAMFIVSFLIKLFIA
jgi:hypothetical protein